MATIVLVHGGWAGAWTWKWTAPLLRRKGFDVYAPTLSGLAERSQVDPLSVNLSTHINEVAGLLEYEDLKDVVLVGQSYSGMVITGAADRAPDRVAGMIYIEGFVPENGQSFWDIAGPEVAGGQRARADSIGGKAIPALPQVQSMKGPNGETLPFTPQPIGCMTEKFESVRDNPTWPPRHYLLCSGGRPWFREVAEGLKAKGGWEVSEIDAEHSAEIFAPQLVADSIAGIAGNWGIKPA